MAASFPSEVWASISQHLKPRHLFKLLQVSNSIKEAVDSEAYWTRVAAHMVWRDCSCMEVLPFPSEFDVMPRIGHDLYYMLGLEHGYKWGMEAFIQRLEDTIDRCMGETEGTSDWWLQIKQMSLAERTREFYVENKRIHHKPITGNEFIWLMKDITMVETMGLDLFASREHGEVKKRLLCNLDDSDMPIVQKEPIFKKMKILLGFEEARVKAWPLLRR